MRERILGSLVGLAAGDCLGAPVEAWSAARIAERYGVLRDLQFEAPIWTDDTQQALVLVESLVRFGAPDPAWVGRRFVGMSHPRGRRQFGCHRGTGSGFRRAVIAFEESGDWRASGRPDRAGNGAAMRIAPLAVALSARDDDAFSRAIVEISMLTHHESRAIAGALAVGRTAARLAAEPGLPLSIERGRALLADLAAWLRERERWMRETYGRLAPHGGDVHDVSTILARLADAGVSARDALPEIERFASDRRDEPTRASDGYVLASVVSAIATTLLSGESFEEMLVRAVNLGGDADTVGAMVGGMAGAGAGLDAIPARWRRMDGHAALLAWGDAAATRAAGTAPDAIALDALPSLLELERRLWERLRAAKQGHPIEIEWPSA